MMRRVLPLLLFALLAASCSQTPPPAPTEPSPAVAPSPSPSLEPEASPAASPTPISMPSPNAEIVASALKDGVYTSESAALKALTARVLDLVHRERWADLDRMAVEMRTTRSSYGSPWLHVTQYYHSFRGDGIPPADDAAWKARFDALGRWRAQAPDSAAAVLALANAHLGRATEAIEALQAGSTRSGSARPEDKKLPKIADAELREAAKLCEEAARLAPDEPEAWATRLRVGYFQKAPPKKMDEWLASATTIDAAYASAWQEYVAAVRHRPGAKPGEWQQKAATAADQTSAILGDGMYALIAWWNGLGDPDVFDKGGLSWARTRQGFIDLDSRIYQRNLSLVSAFCWFACVAQDGPAARALFDRIGDAYLPEVWGSRADFDKMRSWAYQDGPTAKGDPELTGYRVDAVVPELATEGRSSTVREASFRGNMRDLWERERFAELEAIAARLREEARGQAAVDPRLEQMYAALAGEGFKDEEAWQAFEGRQRRWLASVPESVTARLVLGEGYVRHAWDARGSASADNVTPENWKRFEERLGKAHATFGEADGKARAQGVTDPHLFTAWMTAITGLSGSRETIDGLYDRADGYLPAMERKSWVLLPRWLGKAGELEAFAAQASQKRGDRVPYAVAAMVVFDHEGDAMFTRHALKWDEVRPGFEDLRRIAGDPDLVDRFARIACAAGDRATARALMQVIGEHPDPAVWGSIREWERWKKWAGG